MRVIVAVVWVVAAASVAAQSEGKLTRDEAAVRDLVQRYVDAREKRDASALAALFTADADQLTTGGEWRKGREGVVAGGLASSQRNPGTRSITVQRVRFITPNVAIADGGYSISAADGPPRPMWTTVIATLTPEGWRIAAIRNALPTRLPQ